MQASATSALCSASSRRRRPDDLPVARQRCRQHPHLRRRYPNHNQIRLGRKPPLQPGRYVGNRPRLHQQNTDRLPGHEATDAQTYKPADIVALSFPRPDEEAEHIAASANPCVASHIKEDDRSAASRGRTWPSCCAVSQHAEPITTRSTRPASLTSIVGMNNLFGTAEAEAAPPTLLLIASRVASRRLRSRTRGSRPDLGFVQLD